MHYYVGRKRESFLLAEEGGYSVREQGRGERVEIPTEGERVLDWIGEVGKVMKRLESRTTN